jgi:hypothetical protein
MRPVISQREARRLKRRVEQLEERERSRMRNWSSEYPGGTHIDTLTIAGVEYVAIKTAWMLGHPVIVKPSRTNEVMVYAVRQ